MTPLLRATLWPALALSLLQTPPTTVPEEIRRRVESLRNGHAVEVFGVTIPPQPTLAQLLPPRSAPSQSSLPARTPSPHTAGCPEAPVTTSA